MDVRKSRGIITMSVLIRISALSMNNLMDISKYQFTNQE